MNIEKQLEIALNTNHLVLIIFYTESASRYAWVGTVLCTYEKRIVELISVNFDENRVIADSYRIKTTPAFLLLHGKHELWRQVGELTVRELKDVLDDFG